MERGDSHNGAWMVVGLTAIGQEGGLLVRWMQQGRRSGVALCVDLGEGAAWRRSSGSDLTGVGEGTTDRVLGWMGCGQWGVGEGVAWRRRRDSAWSLCTQGRGWGCAAMKGEVMAAWICCQAVEGGAAG